MRKVIMVLMLVPVISIAAPSVSDATARQWYPWNGMVDITGDESAEAFGRYD